MLQMQSPFAEARWRATFAQPHFFSPRLDTTTYDFKKHIFTPPRIMQLLATRLEARK